MKQQYSGPPKWFHPSIAVELESEFSEVTDVTYDDGDVIIELDASPERKDDIADEIEDNYSIVSVADYTENGIKLQPSYRQKLTELTA